MARKMVENSKNYNKEAANLALSVVTIKQCQHCGHPVLDGYCCQNCGSENPTAIHQEPSYIEL